MAGRSSYGPGESLAAGFPAGACSSWQASGEQPGVGRGSRRLSTSSLIAMAKTPSLNASARRLSMPGQVLLRGSVTERASSCATSTTSSDSAASPELFFALIASPSMTRQ